MFTVQSLNLGDTWWATESVCDCTQVQHTKWTFSFVPLHIFFSTKQLLQLVSRSLVEKPARYSPHERIYFPIVAYIQHIAGGSFVSVGWAFACARHACRRHTTESFYTRIILFCSHFLLFWKSYSFTSCFHERNKTRFRWYLVQCIFHTNTVSVLDGGKIVHSNNNTMRQYPLVRACLRVFVFISTSSSSLFSLSQFLRFSQQVDKWMKNEANRRSFLSLSLVPLSTRDSTNTTRAEPCCAGLISTFTPSTLHTKYFFYSKR